MLLKRTILLTFCTIIALGPIGCSGGTEEDDGTALLLFLLLARSSVTTPAYCGFQSTRTLQSESITIGSSMKTGTITSNVEHVYPFTSPSGSYMVLLYGTSSTFDSRFALCSSFSATSTSISRDQTVGGQYEFAITSNSVGHITVGGFSTSSGSYRLKTANAAVTGGGRCTNWHGTFANECLDYDADFHNPSTHCTSISGTYNAGACAVASVQGRCTTREFSPTSGVNTSSGFSTIILDTTDQASDGAMQTYCNGVYGSGNYIYTSS